MKAYLFDEDVWANVVQLNSHSVVVTYMDAGMEYTVILDREETELWDDEEEDED